MDEFKRDLAADLKLITIIPREPGDPVDPTHDIIAPHALRRAIAAEAELENARARADKWEKAFDKADQQYLKQERITADLRRQLAETQQAHKETKEYFDIKQGQVWQLADERDKALQALAEAQQTIARQRETWQELKAIVSTNAIGGNGEDINDYDIMLNVMDDLEGSTKS